MRVVFLGTPEFAVPSLETLIQDPSVDVVAVITQPDRKSGRGQRLTPPPVKVVAERHEIPCHQFQSLRKSPESLALMRSLSPDVAVVVAFGQILIREFFELPRQGTVNVHASILPFYRGAAPAAHAIWNGDSETGVTIMKIDEGMDTGDILTMETLPIPNSMSTGELEVVLAQRGAELLMQTLGGYVSGDIVPVAQDHSKATLAPRIKKSDGRIDWTRTADSLHNQVRAMNPWPGSFFTWKEVEVKFWKSAVEAGSGDSSVDPGRVVAAEGDNLLISCGKGSVLRALELQLPSRKRVSAKDFLNGTQLKQGDRFS